MIHYKYADIAVKGTSNKDYIRLVCKEGDLVAENLKWSFRKSIVNPAEKDKITAVEGHVIGEKKKLASYLKSKRPFLIDHEVAFSRTNENNSNVADRIDMARLVYKSGIPTLQLVEIKTDNDNRLKSSLKDKKFIEHPTKIMTQMRHYQDFLNNEKDRIEKSYKNIAENYIGLGLTDAMPKIDDSNAEEVLKDFQKRGAIDPKPYLLIIGDRKNLKGRYGNHFDRLEKLFEETGYPEPELVSL